MQSVGARCVRAASSGRARVCAVLIGRASIAKTVIDILQHSDVSARSHPLGELIERTHPQRRAAV